MYCLPSVHRHPNRLGLAAKLRSPALCSYCRSFLPTRHSATGSFAEEPNNTPGITSLQRSPLIPSSITKYSLFIAMASLLASGSSIARAPPEKSAPLAVDPNDYAAVADQSSRIGVVGCPIETVMEQLNSLGIKYAMGNGVGRDPKKALFLFALSASYFYPQAMLNLSTMYARGIGVKRDDKMAYGWLRAAIALGARDRILDAAVSRLAVAASRLGESKVMKGERLARDLVISLVEETDTNGAAANSATCISPM
jgi:Sel1 repeat